MKRLILLAWLLAVASCVPWSATAKPSSVTVTGRVLDAVTSKPISAARVGVYQSGLVTVTTDRKGRFKLSANAGGKRIIYYDGGNPLYRSTGLTYTTVSVPARGTSKVIFKLQKVEFGRGRVIDPSGKALAGATVTVCGAEFTHAVTDAKGHFKILLPLEQSKPNG